MTDLTWTLIHKNQLFDLVVKSQGHILKYIHTKYSSCKIKSQLFDLAVKVTSF